jgi:hypothetical protein
MQRLSLQRFPWGKKKGVHILGRQRWPSGEKKKFARNWLKYFMVVYDTILGIHAKNGTENSFKRSFYGTAW